MSRTSKVESRKFTMDRRGDACVARVRSDITDEEIAVRRQDREQPRVAIWPEPTPAEREAILVALDALMGADTAEERPPLPAWVAAGRHEALFGRLVKSRGDWQRSAGRMADW